MFVIALVSSVLVDFARPPLSLDAMPLDLARQLSGKRVRVSLESMKPSYTFDGVTVVGCEDAFDGVERSAVLKGERYDVDGKTVMVSGILEVIDHPARRIGLAFVPAWAEVRVME